MNPIRCSPQFHFDVRRSTVFYRIAEGLFQDSVEAKRNVRRQRTWQILAPEINLYLCLSPKVLTEAPHGATHCPN